MKRNKKIRALLCAGGLSLFLIGALSCAGTAGKTDGAVWSDVQGKEWILSEFRGASAAVNIDRSGLNQDKSYTLQFDAERVSGEGNPNRYFAPYTAGAGNALSIGMIAGTRMALLNPPEGLDETEYFAALSRVKSWNINGGKLELYSADEAGAEIVLTYVQK